MKRLKTSQLIAPLITLFALAVITTGATFAALVSPQVSLTNNQINSASADLRVSADNVSFPVTLAGFNFSGVVPGGSALPANGYTFYLKNSGTANLTIKAAISTTPSVTTTGPAGASVDLSKVSLIFTRVDTGTQNSLSLKSLMDNYASGGLALTDILNNGISAQYNLKAAIAIDAFTAQSASITGINIVFTGTGTGT